MEDQQQHIRLSDSSFMGIDEFLSSTMSSLFDYSIFTVDTDLVINCWSRGATRQLGYEADEVMGKSIDIIYTDVDREQGIPLKDRDTAMKEGKALGNRWYMVKDGSRFFAYGLLYPIRDKQDRIIGFVKILRDITQRKIAEDAINRHIKDLEELIIHKENILNLLSHDLRSPLSTIIGITDYLQSDIDEMSPEAVKEMLAILHHSSTEELNMLDYLVEWARIKHASDVFSPTVIDVKEVVDHVIETFYELALAKQINLQNKIPDNTIAFADKKMITSVVQNLISNALKFTEAGGSIILSSVTDSRMVMVIVKDTGIGMSGEKLSHLFNPELKTLIRPRDKDKGAGIGLLLVKGFMDKNHGEICAESIEGRGTTFYFTLPQEEYHAEPSENAEAQFIEGM